LSTSPNASNAERSSSTMSSWVLKIVPNDIGMTVWSCITVSLPVVREHVVARRVEHLERRLRHDRREFGSES
jgi:hypothetical protein